MFESSFIIQAVISAVFAGCIVSLASFCIEKFGGTVGGVLASSPTTIVAASIGFALNEKVRLNESLYIVPLGLILNANLLFMWRSVPNWPFVRDRRFSVRCGFRCSIFQRALCEKTSVSFSFIPV